MAINFPNSPTNGQIFTSGGRSYEYNSAAGVWNRREQTAATIPSDISDLTDTGGVLGTGGAAVYADMAALIAATGMSNGDFGLVAANNNIYVYNGAGWYKIATVQNDSPSAITGVNGTYELAIDGTATTITAVSTDPEGFPLTWSYSASGLGNIATVSNTDNVFTITPSTTEADAGTFTLTINATDGINGAVSTATNLTLNFILTVTNSNYTTLLATATGTSDNNNITDSSTYNHTITVGGGAHAGTFSPYRSGGYSMYFNSSYLKYAEGSTSNFNMGTNAFTIEAWVRPTTVSGSEGQIYHNRFSGSGNGKGKLYIQAANLRADYRGDDGVNYELRIDNVFTADTWSHICLLRDTSDNKLKLYHNGTLGQSLSVPSTVGILNSNSNTGVGGLGGQDFPGDISNLRVVNGTAIVPPLGGPTEALTSVTNTKLLLNGPNFSDYSGNAPQINTYYGPPVIKAYGPLDYLEYSAADHGGSVYFGGTARQHLSAPIPAFGTQDFEVEFWLWGGALSSSDWYVLFSRDYNTAGSFRIYMSGSGSSLDSLMYYPKGGNIKTTSGGKIKDNVWNHVLLSRVSGTGKWFINGVEDISWSDTYDMDSTATDMYIGEAGVDETHNSSYPLEGYMADIVIRIGGSGYRTSSFTPPTTPLSSTGTELHIKGTDASIIDKSQRYNIDLGSTSIVGHSETKWSGENSIFINSNSNNADLITLPAGVLDASKPFTIEMWLKTLSGSTSGFWSIYTDSTNLMRLKMRSDDRLEFYHRSGSYEQEILDATNTYLLNNTDFYHVAVTRDANSVFYLHQNGIKLGNFTASANYNSSAAPFIIGKSQPATERYMQGYIQDFRITQGLARYTAADETSNIPSAPLEG